MQKSIKPDHLISGINYLLLADVTWTLVVDDDSEYRDLLCEILTDANIDCETAIDGNDAIAAPEYSAERPPGLIVIDLMLPGMDRFELLGKLQKNGAWVKYSDFCCDGHNVGRI